MKVVPDIPNIELYGVPMDISMTHGYCPSHKGTYPTSLVDDFSNFAKAPVAFIDNTVYIKKECEKCKIDEWKVVNLARR